MMRLMGWEGGALGLRGEGIIEPIIPALNINPGAGLGHVSGKPKKKQDKLSNRLQLLEAILDFITKDITQLIIIFNSDVTKKEKRSFNEIINIVNMNKLWNLVVSPENDLFQKIHENMTEAQFKLDLVRDFNRKFILSKILRTEIKGKKSKKETKQTTPPSIIELPIQKAQFKILVLTKILEFQKDKQNPVLNLHFNSILNKRHRMFLEQLCSSLNKRVMTTYNQVPFKDLVVELYQSLDDSFFDITFGLDSRSFTIRKVEENPETNAVNKKENVKTETVDEIQNTLSEISLTDADQSVLCENKTDNAINKQETDKKDSENGNVKDNNNDYGPKEFEPNTGQEVSSNSSTCPKKYEPCILLVKTKTYQCPTDVADLIATKIDSEIQFTPYLKSHGVQDGYMVYSCYKKKSYLWLKKLLKEYQVIGYRGIDGLYALKSEINVNLNFETVSSLLEKYNPGLDTSDWSVLDVYYTNYCKEFLVQLDFNSFEYIRNNNFRLPAGIDDVRFSINIDYYLRLYNRL